MSVYCFGYYIKVLFRWFDRFGRELYILGWLLYVERELILAYEWFLVANGLMKNQDEMQ